MFGEVFSLKELIANKTKSVSEDNCGGTVNCEQNYIRSLQERISSLKRELEQKQNIIEGLLDVNKLRIDRIADMKCPWKRSRFNFGTQTHKKAKIRGKWSTQKLI